MSLSQRIKQNVDDYEKGVINYLPFPKLGKFTQWLPGLMRGEVTCFTGTASSGKTSLVKWLVVFNGIKWAILNKKRFHIIYFGLEESEQVFWYSMLSWVLWEKFKLRYNIRDFECIGTCVKREHFGMLDEAEKIVDRMRPYVTYYDSIYNSIGMLKAVREYAFNNGTFFHKENKLEGIEQLSKGWNHYEPNDPNEFIVPIYDHLAILHTQDNQSEHQAIADVVEHARAYAAKKFNYLPVLIQHQDNTTEGNENRRNHEVLCTMSGLAKNKEVNRSYLNLIGITALNRTNEVGGGNGIQMWEGVNIPKLGNHSRTINILKNRFGHVGGNETVFFDGKCCNFEPLDKTKLNTYYDRTKLYSNP